MKKYTKEQMKWIKENIERKKYGNFRELTDAFNSHFDECRSIKAIRTKVNQDMGLQIGDKREFSEIEKKWIKDNYKKYSFEDFRLKYNELFPERSLSVLRAYLSKNKFYMKKYSEEEETWLYKNFYEYDTIEELRSIYNKKFSRNRSLQSIFLYCNRMGLKKYNPPTQEEIQWVIDNVEVYGYDNLSIKFLEKFNKDIDIVLKNISGLIYIVTNEKKYRSNRNMRILKPLSKLIWEKHNNKILPDDYIIIFLNGDKTDFSIKNLYPLRRGNITFMSKNKWLSDNKNVTLTGIKWCELMDTIKTQIETE